MTVEKGSKLGPLDRPESENDLAAETCSGEPLDDTIADELRGLGEELDGWFSRRRAWADSSILDKYLGGKVCLHLHVRAIGRGVDKQPTDHCAVLHVVSTPGDTTAVVGVLDEPSYSQLGKHDVSVFVDVRQGVDDVKGMFPIFVWLNGVEDCLGSTTYRPGPRLNESCAMTIREDGKLRFGVPFVLGFASVDDDQLLRQVVKGRPKLMDQITRDDAEGERRFRFHVRSPGEPGPSALFGDMVFEVSDDGYSVESDVSGYAQPELVEMVFCSEELFSNSVERGSILVGTHV